MCLRVRQQLANSSVVGAENIGCEAQARVTLHAQRAEFQSLGSRGLSLGGSARGGDGRPKVTGVRVRRWVFTVFSHL